MWQRESKQGRSGWRLSGLTPRLRIQAGEEDPPNHVPVEQLPLEFPAKSPPQSDKWLLSRDTRTWMLHFSVASFPQYLPKSGR